MKAENVPGPSTLGDMKTVMDVDNEDEDDDMEEVTLSHSHLFVF